MIHRDLWMSFHTLASRVGPEGSIDDVRSIARNASQSSGTRHAALFVLHVAEGSTFDKTEAYAVWDAEQRAAYEAWEVAL